jgi:Flp pilus assembly protein TadG
MLFGTFEFGRALWTQASLQYAVQQAARCASVATISCDNSTDTASYAASRMLGITVPAADFTVSAPTCGNKVAASVPFTFVVSRLFSYSITLTASSCYPK